MGDLRNKRRKQEREEALRQIQASRNPKPPSGEPPRCQCGLTPDQVPAMWAYQADRWSAVQFYCPACLPDKLRCLVV